MDRKCKQSKSTNQTPFLTFFTCTLVNFLFEQCSALKCNYYFIMRGRWTQSCKIKPDLCSRVIQRNSKKIDAPPVCARHSLPHSRAPILLRSTVAAHVTRFLLCFLNSRPFKSQPSPSQVILRKNSPCVIRSPSSWSR